MERKCLHSCGLGLGMQNGAGSAADAMELSEDGEIVSESGNASAAVATADSTHVPSSSFVPAAYADHHFGDSTISSNRYPRRFSSPRVKFPIPKWRPLVGCLFSVSYSFINIWQRELSRSRLKLQLLPLSLRRIRVLLRALRPIAIILIMSTMFLEALSH
jgi:hypothetical protein